MDKKELDYIRYCMEGNSTSHTWVPVKSSNIQSVMWISKEQRSKWGTLCVKFKTKEDKPPIYYAYTRIEEELYHKLLSAESIGKFFNEHIKDNSKYPGYKFS